MTDLSRSIPDMLQALQAEAQALLRQGVQIGSAPASGFLEVASVDGQGRIWVLGWSRGGLANSFGVVIHDGGMHPGALVMARYMREDLPDGATGFIGLLQSDWRPGPQTGKLTISLATAGQPCLTSSGEKLRLADMRTLAMIVEAVQSASMGGHFTTLSQLIAEQHPRPSPQAEPADNRPQGPAAAPNVAQIELGIDSVVAIAGVGCLVEGWVLSTMRAVTGFSLQAGSTTARPDPRCSYRLPRPEVAQVLPRQFELTSDAGFVAFFPLADAAEMARGMTLKVHLGEHHGSALVLADRDILWLHRGAGEQALLRLYPAITHEPFFPALAGVLRHLSLIQRPAPVAWRLAEAKSALVCAIADDRSEAYRVIDMLARWAPRLQQAGMGVILLAPETRRADVILLQADLIAQCPALVQGLFLTSGPARPRDVVQVLNGSGAERAVILREGFRIESAALDACLAQLPSVEDARPACLALRENAPELCRGEGPPVYLCTTAALAEAVQRPMAWADLPEGEPLGHALRAVPRPARRPMIEQLEQAGIWT